MMALVEVAKINFGLGIVGWIIVGLVAGWLADKANGGRDSNLPVSFALGIVGALIGGFILGFLFDGQTGLIMSIVVAFIGAMLLSFVVRKVMGSNSPV